MPPTIWLKTSTVLFLVALSVLETIGVVSASYISMTIQLQDAVVVGQQAALSLSVGNKGDEWAYSLKVKFMLPRGFRADDVSLGNLGTDQQIESNVSVNVVEPLKPGSYYALLLLSYRDMKERPYNALASFAIIHRQRTDSSVAGDLPSITIPGRVTRQLLLSLQNPTGKAKNVLISLYLPPELQASQTHRQAFLPPSSTRKISFEVKNLYGLKGSTYRVFALVEYEEMDLHYSFASEGKIAITPEEELPALTNLYLLPVLTAGIALFTYLEFLRPRQVERTVS